ncbi:MAG: cell division protein FtsA [Kiritimatiellae bacterium]|nr:cell division protein FtsA [Kiritimatiellia bacterium]
MAKATVLAGLEIGTTRTVICVGEVSKNSELEILGVGTYPTTGVRKGKITDLTQATVSVEAAIKDAQSKLNVTIWDVTLAVSGGPIDFSVNPGIISLGDKRVTAEDVAYVTSLARDNKIPDECELLHSFEQQFIVDDQPGILNPLGMQCKKLQLDMMSVYGRTNQIANLQSVAEKAQLRIQDMAFSAVCASMVTLTPEQRKNGVVLIELGGGSTNYIVFNNDVICAVGSIGVGGDHVTNDIALAFNIVNAQADEIKRKEGSALVDADSTGPRIQLPQEIGFNQRSISRKALHSVINARMDETFRVIRKMLVDSGLLPHLGGGIVLTGGGAYLNKVSELAQNVFNIPCSVASLLPIKGVENLENPASFATAVGLVTFAWEGIKTSKKKGFLQSLREVFK